MRTADDKTRVFIADDHAIVRRGLIQVISDTPDLCVVGEASNGRELLEQIKDLDIDVLVMDLDMPEKSGWDVIVQLKIVKPEIPVIILSIYPEENYARKFFKAGASGYLNKTSAPEQLVEAVRKVSRGEKFISPHLAEKLAVELGEDKTRPLYEKLSHREFQVFHMIVSGLTVREISGQLQLSLPAINTHRAHILEKMSMKNNIEMIYYAFKNGILK